MVLVKSNLMQTQKCKYLSHETLDLSHLHKHSEEDDCDDGREEHVLHLVVGEQEPQWEGNSTSQATVGHNELVFFGQLHNAELIDDVRETDDSWNTKNNSTDTTSDVFLPLRTNERVHQMMVIHCTDRALSIPDRGPRWKSRRSSSRREDRPPWKHRGRWRWASRSRCSTSSGNTWWWCTTCERCWPPRTDASSRHTLSSCLSNKER